MSSCIMCHVWTHAHTNFVTLEHASSQLRPLRLAHHPLAQLAWWMGNANPDDNWYRTAGMALLAFAVVMTGAAYMSGHAGSLQGGELGGATLSKGETVKLMWCICFAIGRGEAVCMASWVWDTCTERGASS